VRGELPDRKFYEDFQGKFSAGFRVSEDLARLGVVNQTTMLAEETREISQLMRDALCARFGEGEIGRHYADTRDTLCYATSENQRAMRALLEHPADLALVVGGYNSSNTSHLVELCADRVPVFYVKDADEIVSRSQIRHLDLATRAVRVSSDWLPTTEPVQILVSAGASCPDAMVEAVIEKVAGLFPRTRPLGLAAETSL
jgi:4-hydroxy-3-methylbut-2-enyl diphosphate reductase